MIRFISHKPIKAYEFEDSDGAHWRWMEGGEWEENVLGDWLPAEFYTTELNEAFNVLWRKNHGDPYQVDSANPDQPSIH